MHEAAEILLNVVIGFLVVVAGVWLMTRFNRVAKWVAVSFMAAPAVPLALYGLACRDVRNGTLALVIVAIYAAVLSLFLRQKKDTLLL